MELIGGWLGEDGTGSFRVWAPDAARVAVVLEGREAIALDRAERGYWTGAVPGLEPAARYRYRLDDDRERPDPASRWQPEGVHGPSALVDPEAEWQHDDWRAPTLADSVFYELHVGTFSPEGTFAAVIPHLDRLAALGVTTLELLPIAQFPGARNWGYDGVFPYAAQDSYGGLDGLRTLVDAAHGTGLAVVLDVVHNHLGPEGNVTGEYGPYVTDRYRTPWGAALNFDGPGSDDVRAFFIGSACHWVRNAHVDGFRLDATDAIVDPSALPFVEELVTEVRAVAAEQDRPVVIVAENDAHDPRLTAPGAEGGWGIDGQWLGDFHHALRVQLTGDRDGYYQDFSGVLDLATVLRDGFLFRDRWSPYRGRRHGRADPAPALDELVVFSANHDQVGNRMQGERLSAHVDLEGLKLAAAVTLLAPQVPLVFMGDEHADPAPFPYFVSHGDPDLVEAVRRGRREEFARFDWAGEPPDPQAEATFASARIDHRRGVEGPGAAVWRLHQELLRVRRELVVTGEPPSVVLSGDGTVLTVTRRALVCVYCFADRPQDLPAVGRPVLLDTAAEEWGGPGSVESRLQPRSAVVFSG